MGRSSTIEPLSVRADAPDVAERPSGHLELSWRSLTLDDAAELQALLLVCEAADASPHRHSFEDVVDLLSGDWKDLERDSLGGFDASGGLRAFAFVEVRPGDTRTVRCFLTGRVHPQWRRRGLGRALLTWMEGRGRQKLVESGKEDLPARLAVFVDEQARDHRRLYAAAGFSPVRWYTDMRRDLFQPLPTLEMPQFVRIAPWSPELDDAVRRAHNDAFADHWGSEPATPETWLLGAAAMVPEWSFVALENGDTAAPRVVGYLISSRHEQNWPVIGYRYGYCDVLGVRRAARGQGLAAALLVTAMTAYRADGMEFARLSVDTANPSGAFGMYERLGFRPSHGTVLYSVEL